MAARRVLRIRRARIAQIRLELDRRDRFLQLLQCDLLHFVAALGRNQPRHDDEAPFPQHLNLFFL